MGLFRLRQLPPGFLNALTADDISVAGNQLSGSVNIGACLEHIHNLVRQCASPALFTQIDLYSAVYQ